MFRNPDESRVLCGRNRLSYGEFRVRPVMTASIRLRVELFGTLIANCKAGSNFTAHKVREKCRKCEENEGKTRFRETPRDETEMISSQPRYDHFDTSPY